MSEISDNFFWNKFFVLEGLDGAGTTTQARMLADSLRSEGHSVWLTAEPTDGPVGREIRKILHSGDAPSPEAMTFLFAADRAEHLYGKGGIREHLDAGDIVICDRYLHSSLAYQNVGRTDQLPDHVNARFPLPQQAFLLSVPVNECMRRIGGRGEKPELYEKGQFLEKVAVNYTQMWPAYYHIVDGTMTPDVISETILKLVKNALKRCDCPSS